MCNVVLVLKSVENFGNYDLSKWMNSKFGLEFYATVSPRNSPRGSMQALEILSSENIYVVDVQRRNSFEIGRKLWEL